MYPISLQPNDTEIFNNNNNIRIEIPKCKIQFDNWNGIPLNETFGGKKVIAINNKPMFAELGILQHFIKEGWQARWIETYGKSKKAPIFLSEWKDDKYKNQIHQPILDIKILSILNKISILNGNSFSGCWDVLAWKNGQIIFAESKRNKKDSIRETQIKWLTAALECGFKTENFLLVEWEIKD